MPKVSKFISNSVINCPDGAELLVAVSKGRAQLTDAEVVIIEISCLATSEIHMRSGSMSKRPASLFDTYEQLNDLNFHGFSRACR